MFCQGPFHNLQKLSDPSIRSSMVVQGVTVMAIAQDVGSTNYELLRLLKNFDEQFAWSQFLDTYNPMIRNCCLSWGLNLNEVDEVQSLVNSRLLTFFKSGEVNIHTSFRGFLATLVGNEIRTFIRRKRSERLISAKQLSTNAEPYFLSLQQRQELDELESSMTSKLVILEKVITAVRLRVEEKTWMVFWDYSVLNQSVQEVAMRYGISNSAVFKYQHRVSQIVTQVTSNLL